MTLWIFFNNLPARESHYSLTLKSDKKYLSSELNLSILFRNFLSLFPEYDGVISYVFFANYFKKSNISFGFPRSDICSECEMLYTEIKALTLKNNFENIVNVQNKLNSHQKESNIFYELQKKYLNFGKK